jgi:MoxR-like ATPase
MVLHEIEDEPETTDFALLGGWRDFADVLSAGIDRVILYGPPGTGKTYAALHFATVRANAERLVCTEDLTTADVTGCWVPVGEGRWEWLEGPAIRAWRFGSRLVVDEVDRASGDVLSLLLAMTDSEGSSQWRHPHTGEVLIPHREFSVVMTTNLDRLEELPPALRDRFPVAVHIDRPHPASVLALSSDLRRAAMNGSLGDADRRISLRAFYAFDQLRQHCGDERAAALVFGAQRAVAFLDVLAISSLRP